MKSDNYTTHPDYAALPYVLKRQYDPQEFAWLGDAERARLVERECYPECEGDDV